MSTHYLLETTIAALVVAAFVSADAKAHDDPSHNDPSHDGPIKVGFVYGGPVSGPMGDHGWTYRHEVARQTIKAEYGDAVDASFVENVNVPAVEVIIRELAKQDYDLIFTTSSDFMEATLKVAKEFPEVKFENAAGHERTDNVGTYAARWYEGRAITGTVAGHMTKSGIIGYIASFPVPEVIRGINAFTLALRKVKPEAEVKVVWVDSWYDPDKEAEAAKALIDQGADILAQHTDSPAPLEVAEERGVHAFGQTSDMAAFAPTAHLTSIVDKWDVHYSLGIDDLMNEIWKSLDVWYGIGDGMIEMATYGDAVPDEVVDAALELEAAIAKGEVHPFTGPINNQAGEKVVAEDDVIPDEDLRKMDWFVEGVQGTIPK